MSKTVRRASWWSGQYSITLLNGSSVVIVYEPLSLGPTLVLCYFITFCSAFLTYAMFSHNIIYGILFLLFYIIIMLTIIWVTIKRKITINPNSIRCIRILYSGTYIEYFFTGYDSPDALIESVYNDGGEGEPSTSIVFRYFNKRVSLFSHPDTEIAKADAEAISKHLGVIFNTY